MARSFFTGTFTAKLDEKNRFVLPQGLRYQLVEDGVLEFSLALSVSGCLAIYRKSEIDEIVSGFRKLQHVASLSKFFTLFFSTLQHMTCDKVGRISIPNTLKEGVGMKKEIVIAGACNKLELWPKELYDKQLNSLVENPASMKQMMEEAFSYLQSNESNAANTTNMTKNPATEQLDAEQLIANVQNPTVTI